jgi:hypothetical protein
MASEKEAPDAVDQATLSAVRFLVPVVFLALFGLLGALASSSCQLATRDLPEGSVDGEAAAEPPADVEAGPDVDTDCGCCTRAIDPSRTFCSGAVAFEIPAGDCREVSCNGPAAYVVCQEGCYSLCACTLPSGYTLEDGGLVIGDGGEEDAPSSNEAGPGKDAGPTDAGAEGG